MNSAPKQHGSVLVEFILILPLVFLICLAAIDLSRAIRTFKIASTMSREVANMVFRECVTSDQAERSDCLNGVHGRIQGLATVLAPGSEVLVTLFISQPGRGILTETRTVGTRPFRYADTAALDAPTGTNGLLRIGESAIDPSITERQAIVVGEAYVPFNPLVPIFYRYFRDPMVHEVTIF